MPSIAHLPVYYGIRGVPLRWFEDYLNNRQQQVQCNSKTSTLRPIKYGVHQGFILGPLLFLLFINDLHNVSSSMHFELFADDSNISISHKSHENLFQIMNSELPHVGDWFKANKLSLNLTKTFFILFTSHRKILPTQSRFLFSLLLIEKFYPLSHFHWKLMEYLFHKLVI